MFLEWLVMGIKWGVIISCSMITVLIITRIIFGILAAIEILVMGGDDIAEEQEGRNDKAENEQEHGTNHTP